MCPPNQSKGNRRLLSPFLPATTVRSSATKGVPALAYRFCLAVAALLALANAAAAQDAGTSVNPTPPPPDKSGFTLFNPTPDADLRSLTTDRPTKSNSPITVDAGQFQYETDLINYTHSNVGGPSRQYTAFDPVLKVGLTNSIDLELQFNGYNVINRPSSAGEPGQVSGGGDLILRPKFNLFGNEGGPAAALIPYVKFPTASRYIGNGQFEGGVIAPISYPLPLSFTLLVMPEVDVLKNADDDGHHFNFTQLINISHPIGSTVTVYGEFYSALGTDAHSPPVYTFDTAVSWLVTKNIQLDLGTNIGLNRNAPNLQVYTGLSQRF